MNTIIIISVIILLILFLNKTSKSDYFIVTSEEKLKEDFKLIKMLYDNFEIDFSRFKKAWEYFKEHPKEYNGTSVINDKWFIKSLEPLSVVHDYEWIIATSLKELLISNIKYCNELRKVNANWLWVWMFIFTGLNIAALFKSIKYIKF